MFKNVARKAPNKARKAPRKKPVTLRQPTPKLTDDEDDEEDEPAPAPQTSAQPSTSGPTRRRRFKPGSKFITVIYHSKRLIITSCCTERD